MTVSVGTLRNLRREITCLKKELASVCNEPPDRPSQNDLRARKRVAIQQLRDWCANANESYKQVMFMLLAIGKLHFRDRGQAIFRNDLTRGTSKTNNNPFIICWNHCNALRVDLLVYTSFHN